MSPALAQPTKAVAAAGSSATAASAVAAVQCAV